MLPWLRALYAEVLTLTPRKGAIFSSTPDLTQLDLTSPYQVFAALPDSQIHLIAKTADPVTSMADLQLQPTTTFAHCSQLDFICVPGGNLGTAQQMTDPETLNFLRHKA